MSVIRYIWASENSLIGLSLIALALPTGVRWQVHSGVLEAHGGLITWLLTNATLLPGGASAITFGHVVLGRDQASLDYTRSHERVHVRQYERWGPLFLPMYLISSLVAKMRGLDAYRDNRFEREAFDLREQARGY